jgi:hypothetical protein
MASVIYGASLFRSQDNAQHLEYDIIGKNSVAFTVGDPVTVSSGLLDVAGTTTNVVGIAAQTVTMASNNQTVAKVTPAYMPIRQNDLFLMGSTADFTGNATDGGTYFKLTAATTGTVQIDNSGATTGASRVVEIVEVDPFNIGGTGASSGLRQVVVRIIKTPYTNVTITA